MSAILKALQKLEADSNSRQAWKIKVRTVGGKTRRPKRLFFFGTLVLIAALVFAAEQIGYRIPAEKIGLVFSEKIRKYLPKTVEETSEPTHLSQRIIPPPSLEPTEPSPLVSADSHRHEVRRSQPLSVKTAPRPAGAGPETGVSSPVTPAAASKPTRKRPDLKAVKLPSPATNRARPSNSLGIRQKTLTKKQTPSLPLLDDPSVTLQAIAWAEDPKKRISVINGQILREGESLAGIIIDGIKQDRVIVRKGKDTMALMFRNR